MPSSSGQSGQPVQPAGIAAGTRIASYLIREKIGQGGMAVVFRADDERLDRAVALKILEPSLAADEAFRQRFIRESRAAAAVDDPHIIPVFEAGEAQGALFIAMRYVPGGDVLTLADSAGRLPVRRAVDITAQVASALDAAHARGLVHRDVKPGNMLVDPGDEARDRHDHVYLSDFGLSKWSLQNTGLTDTGTFLGTVDYSAPEQIEGKAVDGRSDQYSLACAAFQLLTGAAPFHRSEVMAALYAHVSEPPPALTDKRPDLPAAANAVFARALAKKPADRYPTCREFASALRAALGLSGTTGPQGREPAAGHPVTALVNQPRGPSAGHSMPGTQAATPLLPQPVPGQPPAGYQPQGGYGQQAGYGPPGYGPPPGGYLQNPIGYQQPGYAPVSYPQPAPQRRPRTGAVLLVALSLLLAAGLVAGAIYLRSPSNLAARQSSSTGHGPTGSAKPKPTGSKASGGGTPSAGRTRSPGSSGNSGSPGASSGGFSGQDGYQLDRTLSPSSTVSIDAVSWNSAGTRFATSDKNGATYVWNAASGSQVGQALSGPTKAYSTAISPDGTIVATGYADGSTDLWSVSTGQVLARVSDPGSSAGKEVDSIAFNSTGSLLVTSDGNGYANLWSVSDGGRKVSLKYKLFDPGGAGVWSAAFGGGTTLATGDYSGNVYLWDLATGQETASFSLSDGCNTGTCSAVTALAFSENGRVLAAGSMSGGAELRNIASGANSSISVPAAGQPIWAASFSGSGLLALADNDGHTYLYKVNETSPSASPTGQLADPSPGNQGVGALAFSPSGSYLVTGDTNGDAYLWNLG
jgi:WD40 repeat protein/tRNA A-37 threonylcarbamoyl transferase component Bud32